MLPPKNHKTLFFFHLPKTGGESLSDILSRLFLPDQMLQLKVADQPVCPFNFVHPTNLSRILSKQDWSKIRLVSGHGRPFAQKDLSFNSISAITLLREPIDRMLSSYYYSRYKHGYSASLEELFFNSDPLVMLSNPMTRLFSGEPLVDGTLLAPRSLLEWENVGWQTEFRLSQHPLTESHFNAACENLDKFQYVGVTEHFDGLLRTLSESIDIPPSALRYVRKNVTAKREKVNGLSINLKKRMEDLNEFDIRLYEKAIELANKNRNTTTHALSRRPYFSILIPTRNRSFLIKNALDSVLIQDEADFEVLLIDNNTDDATFKAIESVCDNRLVYLKTGNLTMPENWEIAFQQAQGKYIVILPDRDRFTSTKSLSTLKRIIETTGTKIVTYNWATENNDGTMQWRNYDNRIYRIDSLFLLKSLLKGQYRVFADRAPKGLNSCVSREVVETIKRRWSAFCPPVSPDYTMAYQQLMTVSEIVYYNAPVFFQTREDISCGTCAGKSSEALATAIKEWNIGQKETVTHSPSQLFLKSNTFFSDFFRLSIKNKWGFEYSDLDYTGYFLLLAKDIAAMRNSGENVRLLYHAWIKDVWRLAPELANQIIEKSRSIDGFYEESDTTSFRISSYRHLSGKNLIQIPKPRCGRLTFLSNENQSSRPYHKTPFDPVGFEYIMSNLKKIGTPVSCEMLIEHVENEDRIPDGLFGLCCDGFRTDILEKTLKSLEKWNIPLTVFVSCKDLNRNPEDCTRNSCQYKKSDNRMIKLLLHPLISIGSLTMSAESLLKMDSQSVIRELRDSKVILENLTGKKVEFIAYPYGEYDATILMAAKACGYRGGFTMNQSAKADDWASLALQMPRTDLVA